MKKLIFIPLLFCAVINAQTKFYVAKTGNDSNPGTFESPWLTIPTFNSTNWSDLSAGDTVLIRVGTYNQRLRIYNLTGGSPSLVTVFKAYDNEEVTIDGTGITIAEGDALVRSSNEYTKFVGLTVTNSMMYGITLDDGAVNSVVDSCIVHDSQKACIVSAADYTTIEYNTVYNAAMSNENHKAISWSGGITARGTGSNPISYPIIRHNICRDSWGEGIDFAFVDHGTFEDNTIYDTYSVALYIRNAEDCLIQRNLVYQTKNMASGSQIGIGYWNESCGGCAIVNKNNSFINNVVHGCNRNLSTSYPLINTTFANNTFVNSLAVESYGGIDLGWYVGGSGTLFANNIIIQDNAVPCITYNAGGGVTFSHNLYNKAYDADAVGTDDVTSVTGGHFVDSTVFNYDLKASSPAVDAGLTGIVYYDFNNGLRDAAPDIGAYEYNNPEWPPAVMPSVTTGTVTPKTRTAIATGNVISDGDGTVLARGICYSASANPDLTDSHTHETGGKGSFSSTIPGLTKNTVYHVRAYVTNEIGTSYGADVEFTTLIQTYLFHNGKPFFNADSILIVE